MILRAAVLTWAVTVSGVAMAATGEEGCLANMRAQGLQDYARFAQLAQTYSLRGRYADEWPAHEAAIRALFGSLTPDERAALGDPSLMKGMSIQLAASLSNSPLLSAIAASFTAAAGGFGVVKCPAGARPQGDSCYAPSAGGGHGGPVTPSFWRSLEMSEGRIVARTGVDDPRFQLVIETDLDTRTAAFTSRFQVGNADLNLSADEYAERFAENLCHL